MTGRTVRFIRSRRGSGTKQHELNYDWTTVNLHVHNKGDLYAPGCINCKRRVKRIWCEHKENTTERVISPFDEQALIKIIVNFMKVLQGSRLGSSSSQNLEHTFEKQNPGIPKPTTKSRRKRAELLRNEPPPLLIERLISSVGSTHRWIGY